MGGGGGEHSAFDSPRFSSIKLVDRFDNDSPCPPIAHPLFPQGGEQAQGEPTKWINHGGNRGMQSSGVTYVSKRNLKTREVI